MCLVLFVQTVAVTLRQQDCRTQLVWDRLVRIFQHSHVYFLVTLNSCGWKDFYYNM